MVASALDPAGVDEDVDAEVDGDVAWAMAEPALIKARAALAIRRRFIGVSPLLLSPTRSERGALMLVHGSACAVCD